MRRSSGACGWCHRYARLQQPRTPTQISHGDLDALDSPHCWPSTYRERAIALHRGITNQRHS